MSFFLYVILSKNPYEEEEDNVKKKEDYEKKIYIKYYLGKSLRPNNLQEMIDDLFYIEEILTKNDTLLVVVKDYSSWQGNFGVTVSRSISGIL